jgi:solute carrier family 25 carnitine/acylcarnitine transporter 20/29
MFSITNEYIKGGLIGVSQTIIGHPFDTIKVLQQNNIKINQSILKPKILLSGIKYPIIISTAYNSAIFGLYSFFNKNNMSTFQSGFLSGALMSIVLNPFEYYKINYQLLENKKQNKIWRGIHFTMARESIATGIYFQNYYFLKEKNISPFIAGGIAGCNSWIVTYPIDTIKTRYQSNHNFLIKDIVNQKNIYKGITFCLIRAFLVNGVSFSLYDILTY